MSNNNSDNNEQNNLENLLQQTIILISQQNYELALKFSERIIEIDENNGDGLQFRSLCNLELGNPELAYEDFVKLSQCGDLEREVDAKLYLGQMADGGHNSLECFKDAFESINKLMEIQSSNNNGDISKELRRKATATLVSLAELYMTDLCFEPDAQTASKEYLNKALSIDNTDCDVHTNLASHSISSTEDPLISLQHAKSALQCWQTQPTSDQFYPTTESLRSLSKVFVELSSLRFGSEIIKHALSIDDQDPESWYIAGWIAFLEGESQIQPFKGSECDPPRPKSQSWPESKYALEMCAKIYQQIEYDDLPLLEHVNELLTILQNEGVVSKSFDDIEDEDNDNANDDNEDWISDDDTNNNSNNNNGNMELDN